MQICSFCDHVERRIQPYSYVFSGNKPVRGNLKKQIALFGWAIARRYMILETVREHCDDASLHAAQIASI